MFLTELIALHDAGRPPLSLLWSSHMNTALLSALQLAGSGPEKSLNESSTLIRPVAPASSGHSGPDRVLLNIHYK